MKIQKRTAGLVALVIVTILAVLYFSGVFGQVFTNYTAWLNGGDLTGTEKMRRVSWNPIVAIPYAFTGNGLKSMLLIAVVAVIIWGIYALYNRFDNKNVDERGFSKNKDGTYGTADFMTDKEMKEVLEVAPIEKAEGTILGEYKGKAVCMPIDTKLNRHIAVFGASGTMKSRAVVRNALFQALKNEQSIIVTDTKGELYADTAELYRKNGYDVKVFNLVNPQHGDSWNCMSDLNGDTLLAQVLTNVIIGNTSEGNGDRFWDNGEGNLLKSLILYVDQDRTRGKEEKSLAAVYKELTDNTAGQLTGKLSKLDPTHPARAPYMLFAQASDTVQSGIILGLGTRLQVLQNEAIQKITTQSDIDLTAPGKKKCAYYIIVSDQDTTMAFLSSLFFSFLFIKLTRFADSCEGGQCPVPVNLILDEFNNIGKIGGAEDGSDFARTLSTCRARNIRVMVVVQSLGQLQNRYQSNLWAEIVGNCDIQLMLGCTDDVSAKYFSERSGEMSIEVATTMTTRRTIALAQVIPQYRYSQGHGKRKVLTPDEVLRIPNEKLLCVVRGCNVLLLDKLDYTKHPTSKLIEKSSVYDYNPLQVLPKPKESKEQKDGQTKKGKSKKEKTVTLYGSLDPPKF